MNEENRQVIADKIRRGDELPFELAKELFPKLNFSEKKECEIIYEGKEREEDVIANTLAVPLQEVRTFGKNGVNWHNMLVFGENLQVLKRLLELKKAGKLKSADGTPGVKLVYIDPPFATKQEFRGSQDQKAYQDKIAGAEFVEFLRRRLIVAKELLSEDGNIFVRQDHHFGRVAAIRRSPWHSRPAARHRRRFSHRPWLVPRCRSWRRQRQFPIYASYAHAPAPIDLQRL